MVEIRKLGRLGKPRAYRYPADALNEPPNESYGHKLRRLRLELALTQWEVADMIGVSAEAISAWERGVRLGASPEAAKLARRAIALLSARLRRKQQKNGGNRDTGGLAGNGSLPGMADESLAPLPEGGLRRDTAKG
jgi:DNA-binding XRE family transcriptional regulator